MPKPRLPREAIDLLRSSLDTYARLKGDAPPSAPSLKGTDDEVDALGRRLNESDGDAVWWTDLTQAELCVFERLDDAALRARVGGWRRRMREVVGESRYNAYLAAAPDPKATSTTTAMVRADLTECVRAVYYFYQVYGVAARSRNDVTEQTFTFAAKLIVACLILAYILKLPPLPQPIWFTVDSHAVAALEYLIFSAIFGVVGAVVSIQLRLEDPTVDADPFYRYITLDADRLSTAVASTLFGGIFGMVIFGLLAGGFLTGKAFPDMVKLFADNPTFGDYLPTLSLLYVYAFVAGFAERLVPDALNRIAARALGVLGNDPAPANKNTDKSDGKKGCNGASKDGAGDAGAAPGSLSVLVRADPLLVAVNATTTFTGSYPNGTDVISAASSHPDIATVSGGGTAPGPVTFTVTGIVRGDATITVKSGAQSKDVAVKVS